MRGSPALLMLHSHISPRVIESAPNRARAHSLPSFSGIQPDHLKSTAQPPRCTDEKTSFAHAAADLRLVTRHICANPRGLSTVKLQHSSPPGNASCNAFKTVGKLTVASLYNNVARRVAINEVERLTAMTEGQLRALAKINELMVKHVKERNDVRAKLKELE